MARGGDRYSILALNKEALDDVDQSELKYAGPWYADIDDRDLGESIRSAKELLQKLYDAEVPGEAISIFCSGSKGFHIMVDAQVFRERPGRAIKDLPYIYREIAFDLYVTGLDFQVYSGGKGRMWRPNNALRPDGRYRVRISPDELFDMTPERYRALVSAPRHIVWPTYEGKATTWGLVKWDRALKRARKKEEKKAKGSELAIEELRPYGDDPPGCIDKACEGDFTGKQNFNGTAMQIGIFLARSDAPQAKAESIIDLVAENTTSGSYPSLQDRRRHLHQQHNYMKAVRKYNFSCGAMRNLVGAEACKTCPLAKKEELTEAEDKTMEAKLVQKGAGWCHLTDDGMPGKEVTNFELEPVKAFYHYPDNGDYMPQRTGTSMEVTIEGKEYGQRLFRESAWRSKAALIGAMEGVGNASFMGTDLDVQLLKHVLFGQYQPEEVVQVIANGMHLSKVGKGRTYLTFAEPGWSVNQFGYEGSHEIDETIHQRTSLHKIKDLDPEDEDQHKRLGKAVRSVLQINTPVVMAKMIGWLGAAHLRMHIKRHLNEFPLLGLTGPAGSGKSETAQVLTALNGVLYDGNEKREVLQATSATPWPATEYLTNSTTIPRIVEEMNMHKFSKRGMREHMVELLKGAWNSMPSQRGTVGQKSNGQSGALTINRTVSAPIIVVSEQMIDIPALRERTLSVPIAAKNKKGREADFHYAKTHRQDLLIVGKALTMQALKTDIDWVTREVVRYRDEVLPLHLSDRPRLALAVAMVGYDFMEKHLVHTFGFDVGDLLQNYRMYLETDLEENAEAMALDKSRTEADGFVTALAVMASFGLSDPTNKDAIRLGHHFRIDGHKLMLDPPQCLYAYRTWLRSQGDNPVYTSMRQLTQDLEHEEYFISSNGEPANTGKVRSIELDIDKLREKGVDVLGFGV